MRNWRVVALRVHSGTLAQAGVTPPGSVDAPFAGEAVALEKLLSDGSQQQPAFAAGWITGSPFASGCVVLTALMMAPCMPSAT